MRDAAVLRLEVANFRCGGTGFAHVWGDIVAPAAQTKASFCARLDLGDPFGFSIRQLSFLIIRA